MRQQPREASASASAGRRKKSNDIQGRTQGGGGGGGRAPKPPQNRNLKKNTDFVDKISNFNVIYPSAEISHWNRMMTSTLEFWKIN
jgi:hypothetical protein